MADKAEERAATPGRDCIKLFLQSQQSSITAVGGRQVPLTKAILAIRNNCGQTVSVEPHATLGQEGGTVQDVTSALSLSAATAVSPGASVTWDVYDLLLPAHQGTASKVHMFGYRAVLNWRFELAAWAEYHIAGSPTVLRTPVSTWILRWTAVDSSGAVVLSIEESKA